MKKYYNDNFLLRGLSFLLYCGIIITIAVTKT